MPTIESWKHRCLFTLSKLFLFARTLPQGPYSGYRLHPEDTDPLLAVRRRRRKRCHYQEPPHDTPPKPGSREEGEEGEGEDSKRWRQAASEAFGDNPLPKIERFTYEVSQFPL